MPREICLVIKLFHDGIKGKVLSSVQDASAPFVIGNGVMQGCVFAPVLFNLLFTRMLSYPVQDLDEGGECTSNTALTVPSLILHV